MTISAGVITTGGYLTGKIMTKDRETLAVGGVGQVALPDRWRLEQVRLYSIKRGREFTIDKIKHE